MPAAGVLSPREGSDRERTIFPECSDATTERTLERVRKLYGKGPRARKEGERMGQGIPEAWVGGRVLLTPFSDGASATRAECKLESVEERGLVVTFETRGASSSGRTAFVTWNAIKHIVLLEPAPRSK